MIVNLPISAAGKASNGKPCSCGKNVSGSGSVARGSAPTVLSYFTSPSTPAGALLVPSAASVIRPSQISNRKLQTIRRVGAPLAAPKAQKPASSPAIAVGSNLFRRPASGGKRPSPITNRKFQSNRKSRMRRTGLGDDVDAILDLTYPPPPTHSSSIVVGPMPSSAQILADTGLSPTDTSAFSLNNLLAGSLVLAGTPPGVTPSEYASTITQSTGIPVSPGPTPYVPAPSTVAGANPNLLQTSGVPPAQQQTFSQWLNTKNASVGGLPNWAILAGLGIFGTVIIAGAKKRR